MPTPKDVLARLMAAPGPLDELVARLVDHFLDRPVAEVIRPEPVAAALAEGLRASAADPKTEAWIRAQVRGALEHSKAASGTLRERVPPPLVASLEEVLGRPVRPDPELVRGLMDHPAMRRALRGVLNEILDDFSRRIAGTLGEASRFPGGRGVAQLLGMAKGMASAFTGEVERMMQGRVRAFVDESLGRAADLWVSQLTSERMAAELGAWRVEVLRIALDEPLERYHQLLMRLEPEAAVDDVLAALRGLAAWDGLTPELERALRFGMEAMGPRSLRSLLEGSGLEEGWRAHLESALRTQLQGFVEADAFADWLTRLFAEAEAAAAGPEATRPKRAAPGKAPARKAKAKKKTPAKGSGD